MKNISYFSDIVNGLQIKVGYKKEIDYINKELILLNIIRQNKINLGILLDSKNVEEYNKLSTNKLDNKIYNLIKGKLKNE